MSDDIAAEILRIDARIQRLRSQRAVLLKMQRRNGAATGPQMRARAVPMQKGAGQATVLEVLKAAGPDGVSVDGVFNAVSERVQTTQASVRTMLSILKRKGAVRRLDTGMWAPARRRAS